MIINWLIINKFINHLRLQRHQKQRQGSNSNLFGF